MSDAQATAKQLQGESNNLQNLLAQYSIPGMMKGQNYLLDQLGDGTGVPKGVHEAYDRTRTEFSAGIDQSKWVNSEAAKYRANMTPGMGQETVNAALQQASWGLDKQKTEGMQRLQFNEAQAGMQQFYGLTETLRQGAQGMLGLGNQNMGLALGGNQYNQKGGWSGALGGAASGAAAGSAGGWIGAGIGAIGGGLAGYYG